MSSIINHLCEFAKDLAPIALQSTKALKNLVAPATNLVLPKVSAIYTRFIANTMAGPMCSKLGSAALTAWSFQRCNILLVQVAIGIQSLRVIEKMLGLRNENN